MTERDPNLIVPYDIVRVCEPRADVEQLVLKDVDNSENVYSRTLVKLKGAALPTSQYASEFGAPGILGEHTYPWDLFLMMRYREQWRPSGYGVGNLVYSVSLLPNEELTLEVKTWETDKRLEEKEAGTEARNLSDIKSTDSTASEATNEAQSKEHTYVDAKAAYSGFGFDVSVAAGWSQDVSTLNRNIAKQAQDRAQQATNEVKSRNQLKMAVSRETGSEEKTTRKIKNTNQFHTLNVNYYQVLREYTVSLHLDDVSLVLLGRAPYLDTPYQIASVSGELKTTLQEILEATRSAAAIAAFQAAYGVSPVLVLRAEWTKVLYEGALVDRAWIQYPAKPEERTEFQNRMLQFVRPTPGWVEPDNSGLLRWGYEILPDKVTECLLFLYQFVPYSVPQMTAVLVAAGYSQGAAQSAVLDLQPGDTVAADLKPKDLAKILIPGPFEGMSVEEFKHAGLPNWVHGIVDQYEAVRTPENLGTVPVDGQDSWKLTLPTEGMYADLVLGICSGGEDYYEIQRQLDLELKRAQIEQLRLENALLKAGKSLSTVHVESDADTTAVNLDVTLPKTPATVEVTKETP